MSIPFSRAPHIEGVGAPLHPSQAPNAALLIDFDNVTMGMRSDLSKELKTLLNSEVIRGKVTVQRAYADWRRYPQYIVPLSEASIDLIFAPAYGSSKKNATDIRMAIDGMELVFTRPEIGTYILLTGDSDFSSLVLKLKEYGKYVIGVGIQESSSDILVQNCDEYYSYTSLSGLRKTDDGASPPQDPWVLVERAVEQMSKRNDVMRSDRLKQVMLEMDSGFDEKGYGFSKFSRFLSEAVRKGIVQTQKMENGQYEIVPTRGAKKVEESRAPSGRQEGRRGERGRSERGSSDAQRSRSPAPPRTPREAEPSPQESPPATAPAPSTASGGLGEAYGLLRRAISDLLEDQDSDSVRDSDVKRRMLALDSSFDEDTLGFPKFSRFLRQAHDHEVVDLRKGEGGSYQVALGSRETPPQEEAKAAEEEVPVSRPPSRSRSDREPESSASRASGPSASPAPKGDDDRPTRPLRPRDAGLLRGRRGGGEHPPLFEGQVVRPSGRREPAPAEPVVEAGERGQPGTSELDPAALRLPTGRDRIVQYLSNSYSGVGQKTAETLVDALGDEVFVVLQKNPDRVRELLPASRAEKLLEAWRADFERRSDRSNSGPGSGGASEGVGGSDGSSQATGEKEAGEPAGVTAEADPPRPPARRARRTRGGSR